MLEVTQLSKFQTKAFGRFWSLFYPLKVFLMISMPLFSLAKEHEFGSYRVSINPSKASILSTHDYSIAIFKDGLVTARLSVGCDSDLLSSHVIDLDDDGLFELFVIIGEKKDRVHGFTWNGFGWTYCFTISK